VAATSGIVSKRGCSIGRVYALTAFGGQRRILTVRRIVSMRCPKRLTPRPSARTMRLKRVPSSGAFAT
jgi:hypothetical protein